MDIEKINTLEDQWALGDCSIDFSSFDSNDLIGFPIKNISNHGKEQPMNDCSHAGTISTAGESLSFSWGESSAALSKLYCQDDDDDDDDSDSDDESQSSLTLEDLKSIYVEDQVGIFNPERDDTPQAVRRQSELAARTRRESMKNDVPPAPKQASDFKGDSQNSFTLDDLALGFEEDGGKEKKDTAENDGSLGDLMASPATRRNSRRRNSRKESDLQSILKNGSSNTRQSSSFTMMMMEDSSIFQMSSSLGEFDDSDSESAEEDWARMMNQSLDIGAALDVKALVEKQVRFSGVVVHQHECVLGDNPACSDGAPIMLDWTAVESTTYESVDYYEQPEDKPVRKLDAEERLWRLLDAGATLPEIQQAELEASRTRAERESTRQTILLGGAKPVFYKYIQNSRERETSRPRRRKSPRRN